MATLQDILGGGLPEGLLTAEQQAAAEGRARNAGLLNLAFGSLQASQGQPGMPRPRLGQVIGQAGPVGVQAYQSSFDKTLQDTLRSMQIKELAEKRQKEQDFQKAVSAAYKMVPSARGVLETQSNIDPLLREQMSAAEVVAAAPKTERTLDQTKFLEAIAQYSPLEAAKLMFKEPSLPASFEEYQIAQKDPLYAAYLKSKQESLAPKVNINDPTAVDREIREINQAFQTELKNRGFTEVADRFSFLQSSVAQALAGNTRAHGAIIYNLGKIYDPSGAVQEGDKNTILGNRSIPETVKGIAARVFNGATMTPTEIRDLYENVLINVQQRSQIAENIASGYRSDIERLRPGAGQRIRNPFALLEFEQLPGGAKVTPRNR